MAFSGLHVIAGYAGGSGYHGSTPALLSLPSWLSWSEDPASITTNVAPAFNDIYGAPMFRIHAAADSWVSIGKAPNASTGVRFLVQAGLDFDVFVSPGDKLAWVAA